MKKKAIITISIILAIVILGFILGAITSEKTFCTEMYCSCDNLHEEMPCNSCGSDKPIFNLGLVYIVKACEAKEIIICKDNAPVERRIDIDRNDCRYSTHIFG